MINACANDKQDTTSLPHSDLQNHQDSFVLINPSVLKKELYKCKAKSLFSNKRHALRSSVCGNVIC